MALSALVILLIVSIYTLFILTFLFRLTRTKTGRTKGHEPLDPESEWKVSILVPFRNEQKFLPHLLTDLLAQTYPADQMEILFINDHSEDGSGILFDSVSGRDIKISCLDLPEGRSGKKEALAYGIAHAANPWILQLDADCRIDSGFVGSHMAFQAQSSSDLVAGLVTTTQAKGGFLEHFERLDLLSLAGVGAASFQLGRAMMCSGANLGYAKELFVETRKFDPSHQHASGDDMFLMIGARKLGKTLSFNLAPDSVVRTAPVSNLLSFFDQRIRWGAKTIHYHMPDIQALAILVALTNLSVLLFPLGIIFYPALWPCFLGTWMAKTVADFLFLYKVTGYTGQRKSMAFFLPVSLAYYPVYLLLILSMFFRRPSWKGGRLR